MTREEADSRARGLGLRAAEDASGWRLLLPPGGPFAARGGTWAEAFARLPPPEAEAPAAPVQRGLFD